MWFIYNKILVCNIVNKLNFSFIIIKMCLSDNFIYRLFMFKLYYEVNLGYIYSGLADVLVYIYSGLADVIVYRVFTLYKTDLFVYIYPGVADLLVYIYPRLNRCTCLYLLWTKQNYSFIFILD